MEGQLPSASESSDDSRREGRAGGVRPLGPKVAGGVMLTTCICFLVDRWVLPQGSLGRMLKNDAPPHRSPATGAPIPSGGDKGLGSCGVAPRHEHPAMDCGSSGV